MITYRSRSTGAPTEKVITAPGCREYEATCFSAVGRDAQGRSYVCPRAVRVVNEGEAPTPIEQDPACHRQTKTEASAEAEYDALLHAPELAELRGQLQFCDGHMVTTEQVDRWLADHRDVRRWVERHPTGVRQLLGEDIPLPPHTKRLCGAATPGSSHDSA